MTAPLISGIVALSSKGIGVNSTTAATAPPMINVHSGYVVVVLQRISERQTVMKKKLALPTGDFFPIRNPGILMPDRAATGSPTERNKSTAIAMLLSNNKKHPSPAITM